MNPDNAVIQPQTPKQWPACPNRTAVMVSSPADLKELVAQAGLSGTHPPHVLLNSRMYCAPQSGATVCIAGPFIGAPYAVMLLETMVAWGVERIIVFGWCGSVSPDVGVGDMIIPADAFAGDGTSPHYRSASDDSDITLPSSRLNAMLMDQCRKAGLSCKEGSIWTTDAVFRETPEIIEQYRDRGALAVEMETSALFSAAAWRGVEIAAVLAVSDEVHSFSWKTGFGSNAFKNARKNAIELILAIAGKLNQECGL